jgi:hypothetical protein
MEFVAGARSKPMGLVIVQDGHFQGFDLRKLAFRGTYTTDAQTGEILLDGTLTIPAATALAAQVVSRTADCTIPFALRLPAQALAGQLVALQVPLAPAHDPTPLTLDTVVARFERIGSL